MNTIKLTSIITLLIASTFLFSCQKSRFCINGEGPIVSTTIPLAKINGIDLAQAANIVISQGDTQKVVVETQSNIVGYLNTIVSGGFWSIDMGNDCFNSYDMTIYITVPDITSVNLSGSGNILVNDFEKQSALGINISGSGEIELNEFNGAKSFSLNISGSGNVLAYEDFDSLNSLDINISGSGSYSGFPVKTDNCRIKIPGSGECKVYVRNSLDINISGSGSVFYKGNPSITQKISGSGSIINTN